MRPTTITGQIEELVFGILEENPGGIRWSELNTMIEKINPNLHPKTINGTVWKLTGKYPDKVYKPSKGMFRLTKYK